MLSHVVLVRLSSRVFLEYEVEDTPSLQPFASPDGDGGDASSQRTFFFLAARREGFQNQKKLTIRYDR